MAFSTAVAGECTCVDFSNIAIFPTSLCVVSISEALHLCGSRMKAKLLIHAKYRQTRLIIDTDHTAPSSQKYLGNSLEFGNSVPILQLHRQARSRAVVTLPHHTIKDRVCGGAVSALVADHKQIVLPDAERLPVGRAQSVHLLHHLE